MDIRVECFHGKVRSSRLFVSPPLIRFSEIVDPYPLFARLSFWTSELLSIPTPKGCGFTLRGTFELTIITHIKGLTMEVYLDRPTTNSCACSLRDTLDSYLIAQQQRAARPILRHFLELYLDNPTQKRCGSSLRDTVGAIFDRPPTNACMC